MPEVIVIRDRRRFPDRAAPATKAITREERSREFGAHLLGEKHLGWRERSAKPGEDATVEVLQFGVPVQRDSSLTGRFSRNFRKGAKRLWYTALVLSGNDPATKGLKEPVPADVLPIIATKIN